MGRENVQRIMRVWLANAPRIETGALKIDDDWPGLFIRGGRCIDLMQQLALASMFLEEHVPLEKQDTYYRSVVAGFRDVFDMITQDVLLDLPKPKEPT